MDIPQVVSDELEMPAIISPEMISAGAAIVEEMAHYASSSHLAEEVYRAMRAASSDAP